MTHSKPFACALAAAATLACAATSAQADPLLDASTYASLIGTSNAAVGGVAFSAGGGVFDAKYNNGWGGVGVTGGPSGSEIDIGESITMSFNAQLITDFSLALLYNGPEFGDYLEIAQVAVYNGERLLGTYQLQVGNDGSSPGATWSGFGSVTNLSLPNESGGAAWLVSGNPFGDVLATQLVFTAIASDGCQSQCYNQSDYVLSNVNAVPEPGTYALLAGGLGIVGFMARRRRPQG